MKTFQRTTPLPTILVSALLSFGAAHAGTPPTSELSPTSRTGDAISPNAHEMHTTGSAARLGGQHLKTGDTDQPQALTAAQERLLQLQAEFAASERTLNLLMDRLHRSVRTVEQEALRKKLAAQEAHHRRVERDLRKQELAMGNDSQP